MGESPCQLLFLQRINIQNMQKTQETTPKKQAMDKWADDIKRSTFITKEVQMANDYMEKCFTILASGKCTSKLH